jgi:hypothetical protein
MTGFRLRLTHLIPLLVPLAFLEARPQAFFVQWCPFYILILFYDAFRGIADDLASRVEYLRLINWERFLFFGHIPTIWLQQRMMASLKGLLGAVFSVFYFGHFILPLICLYWSWRKNRRAFLCMIACLSFLSLAGFLTFYMFPAAPPWLAAEKGYLPPVEHLINYHITSISAYLPTIYVGMNSNPVAAFPSLHAGYPLLWFLCGMKYLSRTSGVLLFLNVLGVAFAIVSFGEHYVIDILAGWIYAAITFLLLEQLLFPAVFKEKCWSWSAASLTKNGLFR